MTPAMTKIEQDDWLTDELMQRAANIIQDIDGIASQGSVYVVSRALYEERKRGREEAAKIAEGKSAEFNFEKALADCHDDHYGYHSGRLAAAAAIRSGQ